MLYLKINKNYYYYSIASHSQCVKPGNSLTCEATGAWFYGN